MVYVLKCKYFDEGPVKIFPNERLAVFRTHESYECSKRQIMVGDILWPRHGEEWCIVPKRDVISRARNLGYLNLKGVRMDENHDRAFVAVFNSLVKQVETYIVPLSEIEVLT